MCISLVKIIHNEFIYSRDVVWTCKLWTSTLKPGAGRIKDPQVYLINRMPYLCLANPAYEQYNLPGSNHNQKSPPRSWLFKPWLWQLHEWPYVPCGIFSTGVAFTWNHSLRPYWNNANCTCLLSEPRFASTTEYAFSSILLRLFWASNEFILG